VAPPVDLAQLGKFRTSLQLLPNLHILSIDGSPGGETQISITMDEPAPIAALLTVIDVVEEAIAEELIDSNPLGNTLRKAVSGLRAERHHDEQRVLVILKKG
jgi:hypothetical protein